MEQNKRTFRLDIGSGSVYFHVVDGSFVVCKDKRRNVPVSKLMDFMAIAQELGFSVNEL